MASRNNSKINSRASLHTIKKFELIGEYIVAWAQKLIHIQSCETLVYIDCMCNSGIYHDDKGNQIFGSPIRVSKILRDVAWNNPNKQIHLYFNDIDRDKILELQKHIPSEMHNFKVHLSTEDGNELLKKIWSELDCYPHMHFFLFYDPYDASIDWLALAPFFKKWGEVLINHIISDPIRALSQVKTERAKHKYMDTYLIDDVKLLIPFGSDRTAYEKRLNDIINALKGSSNRRYFIASFPFFNSKNAVVYDLVHCTGHEEGFKLYKETAWRTFDDKSSLKDRHGEESQFLFDFSGDNSCITEVDENCLGVSDIASYVQNVFHGQENVPLEDVWKILDAHPIFPTGGYKNKVKEALKTMFDAKLSRSTISFSNKRGNYA